MTGRVYYKVFFLRSRRSLYNPKTDGYQKSKIQLTKRDNTIYDSRLLQSKILPSHWIYTTLRQAILQQDQDAQNTRPSDADICHLDKQLCNKQFSIIE